MRVYLKRRAWAVGRVGLGVAASAFLGWLAVRGLDWGQVLESFADVSLTRLVHWP